MKAISLIQPYATLIAIEAKHYETRSWPTSYRGPLAIHASKGFPADYRAQCYQNTEIRKALISAGYHSYHYLPRGVIVATCELVACVQVPDTKISCTYPRFRRPGAARPEILIIPPPEPERSFGDYSIGRYAWLLENIKILDFPIEAKGMQGLWDFPGL